MVGDRTYWTALNLDRIQRANLDGTQIEDVIDIGLESPHGLKVADVESLIYWTEAGFNGNPRIRRANLDGSDIETLVADGLGTPTGIALDQNEFMMYWNDCSLFVEAPSINRASLDGSEREIIVDSELGFPVGLAIDAGLQHLPTLIIVEVGYPIQGLAFR